jgi:hypothetical protein
LVSSSSSSAVSDTAQAVLSSLSTRWASATGVSTASRRTAGGQARWPRLMRTYTVVVARPGSRSRSSPFTRWLSVATTMPARWVRQARASSSYW